MCVWGVDIEGNGPQDVGTSISIAGYAFAPATRLGLGKALWTYRPFLFYNLIFIFKIKCIQRDS